jgi:hypothetical protein
MSLTFHELYPDTTPDGLTSIPGSGTRFYAHGFNTGSNTAVNVFFKTGGLGNGEKFLDIVEHGVNVRTSHQSYLV